MSKVTEAQKILADLGLPVAQKNEMAALTLLALCNVTEADSWSTATNNSVGISKDIMSFVNSHYGKSYAPNTRETFRRKVLHQLVQAAIVEYNRDTPELPPNSPKAHYSITTEALQVLQSFGTEQWAAEVEKFNAKAGTLSEKYLKRREMIQVPIYLDSGEVLMLSAGKHNEVQAAVIQEFGPRFAPGGTLLYVGDTAKKDLYRNEAMLAKLGIPIDQHSKLPDVVIYFPSKNWIFLIEAVTSHGPVSPKRIMELDDLLRGSTFGRVYVTAFPDMKEFKKHATEIAWETEVWLMELPDHMIHFNGDRFLGPRYT